MCSAVNTFFSFSFIRYVFRRYGLWLLFHSYPVYTSFDFFRYILTICKMIKWTQNTLTEHVLFQTDTTFTVHNFLDFPSTYRTQSIKRTVCSVLETLITPEQPYLILSTSPVLTMVDTLYFTTTELTDRILMGILISPTMASVKWRFTVLEINLSYFQRVSVSVALCLSFHISFFRT